jgi:nucleotide-binding universal stress UspA family protein
MFDKILVAIDDSDMGLTIFEQALALATLSQSALVLLHVLTPFDGYYPTDSYIGMNPSTLQLYMKEWENVEKSGVDRLRLLEEKATAAGIPTEFTQRVGDPGKLICALAKNWDADLIVVGRRGLSGLSELLMGSVSSYVLHHAHCNVLALQGAVLQRG